MKLKELKAWKRLENPMSVISSQLVFFIKRCRQITHFEKLIETLLINLRDSKLLLRLIIPLSVIYLHLKDDN